MGRSIHIISFRTAGCELIVKKIIYRFLSLQNNGIFRQTLFPPAFQIIPVKHSTGNGFSVLSKLTL